MPLAYYYSTHWPSKLDIDRRSKDSPVLCDPGPSNIQDMFPLPILFDQDVLFWELAVRKFGHNMLYHRAVKQGCRVYYAENRNNRLKCTQLGSASRLGGHGPFRSETGYMKNEIEAIREGVNMTNEGLQALPSPCSICAPTAALILPVCPQTPSTSRHCANAAYGFYSLIVKLVQTMSNTLRVPPS